MRSEVESLLEAHSHSESFLKAPALDVAARRLAGEREPSLVGKRLGAYQVISVLGVGGMGEVYLARDERLKRKLALKLLPQQFTRDTDRVRRFEREARAASALNHPNIITIYEIGEMAGTYFIAAEYVEGQTLRQLIERGPLRAKETIGICSQVADALGAAHTAGLVHRDIKPENVIVRPDGYVKVLDFGLVKLTERGLLERRSNASDIDVTNPGTVLGTVAYMSPEQASGIEVDHRSDLFSLGVLMYELLAGVVPFKGDSTASILDAIVYHQPEPLASIVGDVSAEMERIVNRVLEKDRDLRYQTASDFRAELKRFERELDSASIKSGGDSSKRKAIKQSVLDISESTLGIAAASLIAGDFFYTLAAERGRKGRAIAVARGAFDSCHGFPARGILSEPVARRQHYRLRAARRHRLGHIYAARGRIQRAEPDRKFFRRRHATGFFARRRIHSFPLGARWRRRICHGRFGRIGQAIKR